jgi:hypothetical protein
MAFSLRREYSLRQRRTINKMRYFFDLIGPLIKRDNTGTEFENDEAARQEAVHRSVNDDGYGLQNYNGFHSISVRDQVARIVCTFMIHRPSSSL